MADIGDVDIGTGGVALLYQKAAPTQAPAPPPI